MFRDFAESVIDELDAEAERANVMRKRFPTNLHVYTGVYTFDMTTTTVFKSGNSLAVRIPRQMAKNQSLSDGSEVRIKEDRGAIRIVPVSKKRMSLDEMIKRITPKNRHKEIDWGKPVGKEI